MTPSRDIQRLVDIMATLRTPLTGCAWDLAQTAESILPFTLEETYEVADAVERGDPDDLREELGDLLLQVVFQARIAEEAGSFKFGDVVERSLPSSSAATRTFSAPGGICRRTRSSPSGPASRPSRRRNVQPGVAGPSCRRSGRAFWPRSRLGLPPLLPALRLQDQAAKVASDWDDPRLVLDKIREEADEVAQAMETDAADTSRRASRG